MKILHVIDQISQETSGGSGKVAYEMAGFQAQLGHTVSIYTTDYNAVMQQPPINVSMVKFKTRANLFGSLRFAPGMLIAKYDYDIMHLHNYRTLVNLTAICKKKLFIIQAHGSCQSIDGASKYINNIIWDRLLLQRARRCIADAEREVTQYLNQGVERKKIAHIPIGIDLRQFWKLPNRCRKKDQKTVLFLGRFDNIKGLDLLIKAFRYIEQSDINLSIAGVDYGAEAGLRVLVSSLRLHKRVHWLGPLYGKQKLNALVQADVVVIPSRYEMWGIVFMEALACGTPVIMTDTCEASKILPHECGRSVPFEPKKLAHAITDIVNSGFVNAYRTYRKQWVSLYSWDKIIGRILSLYEGVLNE